MIKSATTIPDGHLGLTRVNIGRCRRRSQPRVIKGVQCTYVVVHTTCILAEVHLQQKQASNTSLGRKGFEFKCVPEIFNAFSRRWIPVFCSSPLRSQARVTKDSRTSWTEKRCTQIRYLPGKWDMPRRYGTVMDGCYR